FPYFRSLLSFPTRRSSDLDKASSEYFNPPHASHGIVTGSAKATSGVVTPFPSQIGQAPKELKLNKPAGRPVCFEKIARISSMIPDRKSTRLNSSHVSISYA